METRDLMNISYNAARKYPTDVAYPDREDFVQESMLQICKSEKSAQHPISAIYFSHKNTFNRQYVKESKLESLHVDISDRKMYSESNNPEQVLIKLETYQINKNLIKKFMKFVPKNRRTIFNDILDGHNMTEVAKRNGYSRQQIHNIYNKVVEDYINAENR